MPYGQGINVSYKELGVRSNGGQSPTLSYSTQTGEYGGRRTLLVAWADAVTACQEAVGYSYIDPADPRPILHRWLPERHPLKTDLVAVSFDLKGIAWKEKRELEEYSGGSGYYDTASTNVFKLAEITLNYCLPKYSIIDDADTRSEFDRFVEIMPRVQGQVLQYPAVSKLVFHTPDPATGVRRPIPYNPSYVVGETDYTFLWRGVPFEYLDTDYLEQAIGTINAFEFRNQDDPPLVFAPQTLLFEGASWKSVALANGNYGWDVELVMRHNPRTWNKLLDYLHTPIIFDLVSIGGIDRPPDGFQFGQSIYAETDFYRLFEPPA